MHHTGQLRKAHALAQHEATRGDLLTRARRALLSALLANGTATADDIRDAVAIPSHVNPTALGSAPGPLARAGIIERAGYAESTRPDAHARPVSVWRLRDRAAALAWLDAHPEPAPAAAAMLF